VRCECDVSDVFDGEKQWFWVVLLQYFAKSPSPFVQATIL
jgi:hypothetical protein